MSSRERRDIRRERSTGTATAPDEVDGEEPEGDLTVDQTPVSSLDDLTTPADPGEFATTFTDDDALLDLQGGFDPTAGSKQVIPRIAYTINFNFVWNPNRQRWEPDEGNESGGNVVATGSHTVPDGSFVVSGFGVERPPGVQYDVVAGPADLSETNQVIEFSSAAVPSGSEPTIATYVQVDYASGIISVQSRSRNVGTAITVEFAILKVPTA